MKCNNLWEWICEYLTERDSDMLAKVMALHIKHLSTENVVGTLAYMMLTPFERILASLGKTIMENESTAMVDKVVADVGADFTSDQINELNGMAKELYEECMVQTTLFTLKSEDFNPLRVMLPRILGEKFDCTLYWDMTGTELKARKDSLENAHLMGEQ